MYKKSVLTDLAVQHVGSALVDSLAGHGHRIAQVYRGVVPGLHLPLK